MNKRSMLKELENVKNLHIAQMDKVELLLEGYLINEPTELGKMECEFGKIFYGHQELFFPIIGAQFFQKIDFLHEQWHAEYSHIYNIFYKKRNQSFFSKMRGHHKIKPVEYNIAHMHYRKLNATTNELLRVLNSSIRRVEGLNESKFKN